MGGVWYGFSPRLARCRYASVREDRSVRVLVSLAKAVSGMKL